MTSSFCNEQEIIVGKKAKKVKKAEKKEKQVGWGLVGYGGAFNMGRAHGNSIEKQTGMKVVAAIQMIRTRRPSAIALESKEPLISS